MKDNKEGTNLAAYSSALTLKNLNNENQTQNLNNAPKHHQEETKFDQFYSRSSSQKAIIEAETMSGNKKLSINEEGSLKSFDDQKQSTGVFGGAFEENLSELAQIKYRAIDDEIMPPQSIQNAQVAVETPKPI